MPLAACSRLCSRDSACVCVFARSARSSVWYASEIVSTEYHLFLAFFSVNPFDIFEYIVQVCLKASFVQQNPFYLNLSLPSRVVEAQVRKISNLITQVKDRVTRIINDAICLS